MTKAVKEMYVYVSVDAQGNEGIIGGMSGGVLHPLVTSERHIAKAMADAAREGGEAGGVAVKLYKFTDRTLVSTVTRGGLQ